MAGMTFGKGVHMSLHGHAALEGGLTALLFQAINFLSPQRLEFRSGEGGVA